MTRDDLPKVRSLSVITFGQPAIGDATHAKFLVSQSSRYSYRRYVTYKNSLEEDPFANFLPMLSHVVPKIPLFCGDVCPMVAIGLHLMYVYHAALFNPDYTLCRSNCYFDHNNGIIINRSINDYCKTSNNWVLSFDAKTWIDKYSVCLFETRESFKSYTYSTSSTCKGGTALITKSMAYTHVNHVLKGGDTYLVVENNNAITPTVAFGFQANFTSPNQAPDTPTNLVVHSVATATWTAEWDSPVYTGYPACDNITYTLYISAIGKDWTLHKTTLPKSQKKCRLEIPNLPGNTYIFVVTASNSLESHPSKPVTLSK
eukprot:gene7217-8381_t